MPQHISLGFTCTRKISEPHGTWVQVSDRSKPAAGVQDGQSNGSNAGLEARIAALEDQIAELVRLQKQQLR